MTDTKQPNGEPEEEQFRPDEQRRSRNRRSQLLAVAAILVTIWGAFLAIDRKWYGFVLVAGGVVALIAMTRWSIRNWNY